jgi:C-terminal processing protease CtpA/Prc
MRKLLVIAVTVGFALLGFAQSPPAEGGEKAVAKDGGEGTKVIVIQKEGGDGQVIKKEIRKVMVASDRPRLGLSLTLEKGDGQSPEGPTVAGVAPGSGAQEAGILKGDVILKMDGKPLLIRESEIQDGGDACKHVELEVPDFQEGQQVLVEFKRGGEVKQATVTAKKLDGELSWVHAGDGDEIEKLVKLKKLQVLSEKPRLGMALMIRSEGPETAKGPVVAGVSKGSGAEEAGIRKGDVILSMDGKPLLSGEGDELDLAIPDFADGQKVLVRYEREGTTGEAVVTAKKLDGGDIPVDWIHKDGCEEFLIQEGTGKKKVRVIVETHDAEEKAR